MKNNVFQKKKFSYEGYNKYLYTGMQGFVMKKNHKILSSHVPLKQNKTILDIGGAAAPHCSIINLDGVSEYWISDYKKILDNCIDLPQYNIKKHYFNDDPDFDYFNNSEIRFTRIIASHVWEHVENPEETLLKWVSLLDEDGQLDIAIPCDPGWAWRLGQLVGRKKAVKVYGMSSKDIDLMMTREHVNSCQNLIRIIKSYTDVKAQYYPFKVPITDINLFIFFSLKKSDFIS